MKKLQDALEDFMVLNLGRQSGCAAKERAGRNMLSCSSDDLLEEIEEFKPLIVNSKLDLFGDLISESDSVE